MKVLWFSYSCKSWNVLSESKKYCFRCKKVSPEAVLFTTCRYILLFATVLKCIAPLSFNHIMYYISDFLLVPAEIKFTLVAPSYILFLAGSGEKSEIILNLEVEASHNMQKYGQTIFAFTEKSNSHFPDFFSWTFWKCHLIN